MKKIKDMSDRELQEKLVLEVTTIRMLLQNLDISKDLNHQTLANLDEFKSK